MDTSKAGRQVGEKGDFLGSQKFLADEMAEDLKIWPDGKNIWLGRNLQRFFI